MRMGEARSHAPQPLPKAEPESRCQVQSQASSRTPADPLSALLRREASERIATAVDALPEKYRVPLVLRFQAEQSYTEIAEALDVEVGQVASLLFRARKRLRDSFAEEGSR